MAAPPPEQQQQQQQLVPPSPTSASSSASQVPAIPLLSPAKSLTHVDRALSLSSDGEYCLSPIAVDSPALTASQEATKPVSVRIIHPDEYELNTWKNGLGAGREIALFPKVANYQQSQFLWRVSISEIHSSCAFSFFSGFNRLALRLDGDMVLNHNNSAHSQLVKKHKFYEFSGDWSTTCEVTGPNGSTDFHVIYRKDSVDVSADVFDSRREEVVIPLEPSSTTLLYSIAGENVVQYSDETYVIPAGYTCIFNEELSGDDIELSREHNQALVSCGAGGRMIYLHFHVHNDPDHMFHDDQPSIWRKPQEISTPQANDFREIPPATSEAASAEHKDLQGRKILDPVPSTAYSTNPQAVTLTEDAWDRAPYYPPVFSPYAHALMPPPSDYDSLDIEKFETGKIHTGWINILQNGLGEWVKIPFILARGASPGPVLGITAAVHGNELNGVPCIHRLMASIRVSKLKGSVVAVPCVNITGYLSYRRQFRDGHDLNRTFPGRPGGFASQVFCHQLLEKLIRHFNYHIDLHTASFGRINSYYIRADMLDPVTAEMSLLCNPQIILHNSGQDGTLRGAATQLGIKSITVEIGNPQSLQSRFISWTYAGTRRIMSYLNMYPLQNVTFSKKPPNKQNIILCSNGFWMYTNYGGVLEVYPPVNSIVQEGDLIARVKNIFGNIVEEIFAPCKGVCIGRSSNPVAYTGDRIIHLGVPHDMSQPLPKAQSENY